MTTSKAAALKEKTAAMQQVPGAVVEALSLPACLAAWMHKSHFKRSDLLILMRSCAKVCGFDAKVAHNSRCPRGRVVVLSC